MITHRPVRVLFVDHADFLGGAEQSLLEVLRLVDTAKINAALACPDGALMREARSQGTRVFAVNLGQMRGRRNLMSVPFKLIRGVLQLTQIIRREKIDIVHSNTMRASIYSALAAHLSGAKFVWHVHDLYRSSPYLWLMSRLAHAILTNSQAAARLMPSIAQSKTTVIYHGVTMPNFAPSAPARENVRSELGVQSDELLIGNVGWVAPWKGQQEFIEVARLIARQCPQARFVLVGAASDERYAVYEQDLRALGARLLGDRLIFTGARSDVPAVLSALDLLLHCAKREPFGRVLVEAMATQVPVIAFSGGGPDEIIAHGATGLLVDAGDVAAMARAALELLAEPDRRLAMGVAGRERAASVFEPVINVRRIEDRYLSLVT